VAALRLESAIDVHLDVAATTAIATGTLLLARYGANARIACRCEIRRQATDGDQVDVMAVSVAPLRRERTIGVVIKGAMSGWRRQRRTDESGERQASSTPRMTASPGTEAEVGSYFRGIPGSRGSTYADEGGILDVVPPSAAPRSIIAADLPAPPKDNGAPFASPAT
jgi:hypothetical protein